MKARMKFTWVATDVWPAARRGEAVLLEDQRKPKKRVFCVRPDVKETWRTGCGRVDAGRESPAGRARTGGPGLAVD